MKLKPISQVEIITENIAELQAAWNSFNFADGLHDKNAVDCAVYRILAAERAIAAQKKEANRR